MKAPAFQFYVRDWILSRSVQKMNGEEVKAYIYLLCESWLEDPRATLPNNEEELARMAQVSTEKWHRVKPKVMANFKLLDDRWINEKLLGISENQSKFKNWGKLGGNPKLTKNKEFEPKKVNPIVNPIVNGSLNPIVNLATATSSATATNASNLKREGFKKPEPSQVEEYGKSISFEVDGKKFCDYYDARGWKLGKGVSMRDWKAAVRTWKGNDFNNGSKPTETKPTYSFDFLDKKQKTT